jgi:hypothetical protein
MSLKNLQVWQLTLNRKNNYSCYHFFICMAFLKYYLLKFKNCRFSASVKGFSVNSTKMCDLPIEYCPLPIVRIIWQNYPCSYCNIGACTLSNSHVLCLCKTIFHAEDYLVASTYIRRYCKSLLFNYSVINISK